MSTTIPPYKNNSLVEPHIFPDSGPSICLARPNFLKKLNIKNTHLIPCYKNIKAVDGSILICHGMLPVNLTLVQTPQFKMFISVISVISVYILVKQFAKKPISYCHVFHIPCHHKKIPLLLSITHKWNHP